MKIEWAILCTDAERGPDGLWVLRGVEPSIHAEDFPVTLNLRVMLCLSLDEPLKASSTIEFQATVLDPDRELVYRNQIEMKLNPARHGRTGTGVRTKVPYVLRFNAQRPGLHSVEIITDTDSWSLPLTITSPGRN